MGLKIGQIRVFRGTNWRLSADRRWRLIDMDVPKTGGVYMGTRQIYSEEYDVYRLGMKDWVAQKVSDES